MGSPMAVPALSFVPGIDVDSQTVFFYEFGAVGALFGLRFGIIFQTFWIHFTYFLHAFIWHQFSVDFVVTFSVKNRKMATPSIRKTNTRKQTEMHQSN